LHAKIVSFPLLLIISVSVFFHSGSSIIHIRRSDTLIRLALLCLSCVLKLCLKTTFLFSIAIRPSA
ncbi:hypothetical protein, partial [Pseudoramibacter alactolyticus]|uniref:hypothetical protein n=1 Tax=Pseudoramibacter alactolyticus TaxID=113287 RepID=UPI0023560021